jgi:hypothetical protein
MRIGVWVPYTLMLMVAVFVGPNLGAWVEQQLNPILVDSRVERVVLKEPGHQLCWVWIWSKARPAAPRAVRYYLQIGPSDPVPVFVLLNGTPVGTVERPPGRYVAEYCAPLPPNVPPARARLTGHIIYDMPHGLWEVRQDLPTVTFGEEPQS